MTVTSSSSVSHDHWYLILHDTDQHALHTITMLYTWHCALCNVLDILQGYNHIIFNSIFISTFYLSLGYKTWQNLSLLKFLIFFLVERDRESNVQQLVCSLYQQWVCDMWYTNTVLRPETMYQWSVELRSSVEKTGNISHDHSHKWSDGAGEQICRQRIYDV